MTVDSETAGMEIEWVNAEIDVNHDPLMVPMGESLLVWSGALALASKRHPHAPTPDLADIEDARIALTAATALGNARET